MKKIADKNKFKYIIVGFLLLFGSVLTAQAKININFANINELTQKDLKLSAKRAQAIIDYRNTHGPLKSEWELAKVRWFSKAYVKKNLTKINKIFTFE